MRYLVALAFLLLLVGQVWAVDFSVGVSPAVVNVGDVSPGEQKIITFSIFSVSDENLLVYLDSENGNMDFFSRGYTELMGNFSEEPDLGWIQFINNPVLLDVTAGKTVGRTWHDVNIVLNVPATAEPGYHVIKINPRPTVYGSLGSQVGTNIVATTAISVLFNVKGPASREGVILDSTANGYADNSFSIKTFFQNTGADTLYVRGSAKIFNADGTVLGQYYSAKTYVSPKTVATLELPVADILKEGTYNIESSVAFTTGMAEKNATIRLTTKTASPGAAVGTDGTWIIILAIIIVIIVIFVSYWWFRERH